MILKLFLNFIFLFIYVFYIFVCVRYAYMCLSICAVHKMKPKEGVRFLGAGVRRVCKKTGLSYGARIRTLALSHLHVASALHQLGISPVLNLWL